MIALVLDQIFQTSGKVKISGQVVVAEIAGTAESIRSPETNSQNKQGQRTLTYFVRGSITVLLTSCLTDLDLTKRFNLYLIQHQQSS